MKEESRFIQQKLERKISIKSYSSGLLLLTLFFISFLQTKNQTSKIIYIDIIGWSWTYFYLQSLNQIFWTISVSYTTYKLKTIFLIGKNEQTGYLVLNVPLNPNATTSIIFSKTLILNNHVQKGQIKNQVSNFQKFTAHKHYDLGGKIFIHKFTAHEHYNLRKARGNNSSQ